jgi:hypothetical protein
MVSVHCRTRLSWSHTTSCTHPVQSIQENIIFHHANDRFSLEVLTHMGDAVLDFGTWECSFPFRANDRVRPRRSSDEVQHKQSHESQSESTRCHVAHSWMEKLSKRPRSSLFQRSQYLCFSTINASYIVSCAPPPFVNLRTRFLFKGEGCNTLCYGSPIFS